VEQKEEGTTAKDLYGEANKKITEILYSKILWSADEIAAEEPRHTSRPSSTYTWKEGQKLRQAGIDACLFLEGDITSEYREISREINK
jgi:hypothetical protein